MNITDIDSVTPLTPHAYYVLLALAAHQNSGYGIAKAVTQDSNGTFGIKSGTLYPLLKRLAQYNYIQPHDVVSGSGPNGTKTIYYLTGTGRRVLELEHKRYSIAAQLGDERLHHDGPLHDRVQ